MRFSIRATIHQTPTRTEHQVLADTVVMVEDGVITDAAIAKSQAERDALDLDETIILLQEAFAQLTPQLVNTGDILVSTL